MAEYIRVVEDESCPDQAIEIPAEPDGTLLLSNIQGQFPGACGLRYRSVDTQSLRGVRLAENTLYPPFEEGWGAILFMVVPSKIGEFCSEFLLMILYEAVVKYIHVILLYILDTASKRKIEESPTGKEPESKITKVEGIGDLIVLGLPYRTTEPEMKDYFGQFGEVDYCEEELNVPKKLFVGRLPDGAGEKELQEYFGQYGDLTDVYIPKPNRNFGFVTFSSGEIAQSVVRQNHRLRENLLNVSFAEPKANSMRAAAAASSGYPMGVNMGYNMWNSGWGNGRQGGVSGYNSNAASAYNMMNMMNPAGMQGMIGTGDAQ
ncbi:hypothetical protein QZH41_018305 [Actinostola sp. cb2023]|nr:hypothetical protein QZH41_018305 [Actinostola sp. cb2023]